MRNSFLSLASAAIIAAPLGAQTTRTPTADEIIARFIKTVGGAEKIQSIRTLRRVGKFTGDDGFEAAVIVENTRPNKVREEFSIQGMTGVNAYDGANGWKIDPFGGKKDPESLSEEEMRSIVEDSDFDEPLINYQQKGNKVELVGMDQIEGTDVYKLKVTLKSGDTRYYYMDTDSYVPIKYDTKRIIRGTPQETETTLGDYKQVGGWYLPFSLESRQKAYGFKPDQAWLDHVRLSSLRLARGCSASFVSPYGLVQTNHHCARACIEQLSTATRDLIATGFYANEARDELKCPDVEANQLIAITDETDRINRATASKDGQALTETKKAIEAAFARECSGNDANIRPS